MAPLPSPPKAPRLRTVRGSALGLFLGPIVGACLLLGCGGATSVAPPAPAPPPAALSADRVTRLRERAPELAHHVLRLDALARARAESGDAEAANELASLAEVTLLAASEMIARHDAEVAAGLVSGAHDPEVPPEEIIAVAPEPEPAEPPRRRRRRPTEVEEAPEETPPPVDQAARVRERLAQLATRLGRLDGADNRVAVESVQTSLIEADRALAEGLVERAEEFAMEADRALAALTGEPTATEASESSDLVSDARRRLGARATVRGGEVAIRLDTMLGYENGQWRARDERAADHLRTLVRGYRAARISLVTVGTATAPEFASERDALVSYLVGRFQIPTSRLTWSGRRSSLAPGTYLLLQESG